MIYRGKVDWWIGLSILVGIATPALSAISLPSSDSRSSMALSLDRVLIEYAGGSIMIAPDDQVRFFEDIASHCPQLSWQGMDLVIALN